MAPMRAFIVLKMKKKEWKKLLKQAHEKDPRRLDNLIEIYHTTDMDQEEFEGWVKLIAESD